MTNHRFENIEYLLHGTDRAKEAYRVLQQYKVMDILSPYTPMLTGTIPIDIDIEGSDLDVICEVHSFTLFEQLLKHEFGKYENFKLTDKIVNGIRRMKANFRLEPFEIEVFGQPIPVFEQNAYRHMLIEDRILHLFNEEFKEQVRSLKRTGDKTEPAFAMLIGLDGDPYESLLEVETWSDEKIVSAYRNNNKEGGFT